MPIYRVKPGYTHGAFNQHKAGDTVELTTQEAAGFLDKLMLVEESLPAVVAGNGLELSSTGGLRLTLAQIAAMQSGSTSDAPHEPNGNKPSNQASDAPPEPFDVANATVDDVVAAVAAGTITASDALIAEQQGKQRVTLIEALTKLVEAEQK